VRASSPPFAQRSLTFRRSHWGYALFALHAALAAAPPAARPPALTLYFDARVSAGDWVRAMLAALGARHGLDLQLSPHAAAACAPQPFARLDANDARPLRAGAGDAALREAWREACGEGEAQAVAVSAPRARARARARALTRAQDVLIYNRDARSTRRLCNLGEVQAALAARGLTHTYLDIPPSACAQVAALAAPRRFIITPHGAHEARRRRARARRRRAQLAARR